MKQAYASYAYIRVIASHHHLPSPSQSVLEEFPSGSYGLIHHGMQLLFHRLDLPQHAMDAIPPNWYWGSLLSGDGCWPMPRADSKSDHWCNSRVANMEKTSTAAVSIPNSNCWSLSAQTSNISSPFDPNASGGRLLSVGGAVAVLAPSPLAPAPVGMTGSNLARNIWPVNHIS